MKQFHPESKSKNEKKNVYRMYNTQKYLKRNMLCVCKIRKEKIVHTFM